MLARCNALIHTLKRQIRMDCLIPSIDRYVHI